MDLKLELEAMLEADQSLRILMDDAAKNHGVQSPEMAALWKRQAPIDAANLARIVGIIDSNGWPNRSSVGDKASDAVFFIIQHASESYQKKYFPMLRAAAAAGEALPKHVALLQDRILMTEGERQLYGSQLQQNAAGGWEYYPIEDEENVDRRRAEVGLPPLAENAKRFGFEYRPKT